MDIQTAKQIRLEEYLHSLGYSPVKRQGINLWYKSPFREETEASFKVNTERNQWYDFALGKGGNIIALASHIYATDSVPYLLKRIEEQAPHVRPVSFSFRKQSFTEPSFQQLEIVPLSSPALLAYLQDRGINPALAKRECRPKEISHIRQSGEQRNTCFVFEGFMDYLSFLTLRLESCPQCPDFDRQDYMVLNSVANVSKALYPLGSYERIHCFFDNDRAGMEALQQIRKEYDSTRHIRDASQIYCGCKDLNEYLQKRMADGKEQMQSVRKRDEALSKKPKGFRL